MDKKVLKQVLLFVAAYNWFLSIGVIVAFIPIWNELNLWFHIPLIILAVIAIIEIPCFIYLIWWYTKHIRLYKKFYSGYDKGIKSIRTLHAERYSMYLRGDTQSVDEYTARISENAQEFIQVGESMLKIAKLNETQKQRIQYGIEELQYLQNNVKPKNRAL